MPGVAEFWVFFMEAVVCVWFEFEQSQERRQTEGALSSLGLSEGFQLCEYCWWAQLTSQNHMARASILLYERSSCVSDHLPEINEERKGIADKGGC